MPNFTAWLFHVTPSLPLKHSWLLLISQRFSQLFWCSTNNERQLDPVVWRMPHSQLGFASLNREEFGGYRKLLHFEDQCWPPGSTQTEGKRQGITQPNWPTLPHVSYGNSLGKAGIWERRMTTSKRLECHQEFERSLQWARRWYQSFSKPHVSFWPDEAQPDQKGITKAFLSQKTIWMWVLKN